MPVGPHMPDLDALSLLVEVARGGSIGAAARSQGISQQAASERLQAIERQVGVPLLQRGSRGSTPTPAGAVLVEWSTRLLTVADEVEAAIGSLRTGRDRELRIVASMTIAEHLLPRWLVLLRRHQTTRGRPLSVSLTATNSREAVASVTRGDADLGFVEGANAPTGLGVLDISADELVLTASPSDPLTRRRRPLRPHDVAALALTSRELGSGTREIVDLALTAHGLTPVPAAAEFTTSTAVREAIRAGSPPGFLSLRTIGDELRSGALVVIPTAGLALERTFRAIWPADRDRRPGRPGSCSGLRRVRDGVVDRPAFRRRVTVFDRADVGALISPAEDANVGPDPAKLAAIVQEFLRQQAIFPAAVVGRTDWLLGQEGVHNARLMLYQLFVETNQPLPPMGVKQWSSKLTPAQRSLLQALAPPTADRGSVLSAMVSVRAAFRTSGRSAAEAGGLVWPTEGDDAVTAYWERSGLVG